VRRQRRDDDRNLFLDILGSARDFLHLSYSGRDIRDNAELHLGAGLRIAQPSVDGSRRHAAGCRMRGARPGAAAGGSPAAGVFVRCFVDGGIGGPPAGDSRLTSFDRELCEALKARHAGRTAATEQAEGRDPVRHRARHRPGRLDPRRRRRGRPQRARTPTKTTKNSSRWNPAALLRGAAAAPRTGHDTDLPMLQSFLRNPCKTLLAERLGIRLQQADEALETDEPYQHCWAPAADGR
jgi:exodeoxyribonuclease V gamma subunit